MVKAFSVAIMSLCALPSQKLFLHAILLELVEKTKKPYVFPLLNDYCCATTSFNLWMSKGAHDVFALVIIILGSDYKLKQVTFDLFEIAKTTKQMLAKNLIDLLDAYGLKNKVITYLKDEVQI